MTALLFKLPTQFLLLLITILLCSCGTGLAQTPEDEVDSSLTCWSGTSNPRASVGYPPEKVDCTLVGGGGVCEMTYVASLNLYSMSCSTEDACYRKLNDFETGSVTSLWDEVRCCTEDHCNASPDLHGAASTNTFGSLMVVLAAPLITQLLG